MELNRQALTGVAGSIQLVICPAVALMSAYSQERKLKRCRLLRRFLGKETISDIEFEAKLSGVFNNLCKVGIYVYQFVTSRP